MLCKNSQVQIQFIQLGPQDHEWIIQIKTCMPQHVYYSFLTEFINIHKQTMVLCTKF